MATSRKFWLAAILFAAASAAQAVVITFDPLSGNNGDAYTGHTEAGFETTVNSGSWSEGHVAGNPVPSIFTREDSSVGVALTGGGVFSFTSVDLNDGNNSGTADYSITGLLGAATVFSIMGDVPLDFGSPTASPSSAAIDTLIIALTLNNSSSANIDNIVLGDASVPVPGVLMLLVAGIAGLSCQRRKQIKAA